MNAPLESAAPIEVLLNAIMGVVREREAERKWG